MAEILSKKNALTPYFTDVADYPILTKEEEYSLANKLRDTGDIKAAQKLASHNLKFVIKVAHTYSGYGLPLSDLIQEGNVGLMKAIKRFSTSYNVRLITYAAFWIKAEMNEFVMRNIRIVRMGSTKPQRKLFFSLRSMKTDNDHWLTNNEIHDIADKKNVTPTDVRDMELRLFTADNSYEVPDVENEPYENILMQPSHYLESDETLPDDAVASKEIYDSQTVFLKDAFNKLNDNHKNIIQHRWLNDEKTTLRELAAVRGVSCEAIRQAEVKALRNLRKSASSYESGALL